MRKFALLIVLTSCLRWPLFPQPGQDKVYRVTQAYQANDQGQVLNQQAFSGEVVLSANGN